MRRCSIVLMAACLLATALSGTAPADVPRALISDRGTMQLVGLDGRHPVSLGIPPSQADWSPDGARLAYTTDHFRGDGELRVVQADGTGDRLLHRAPVLHSPAWTPDGSRIAFVQADRDDAQTREIWTADPGSGRRALVARLDEGLDAYGLIWSPEGTRIAFRGGDLRNAAEVSTVMVLDTRDGRVITLVAERDRNAFVSDWHPTADRLLFFSLGGNAPEDGRMEVIRPDGTGRRELLRGKLATVAQWSPDGTTIAFTLRDELHLMSADGRNVRRVTPVPVAGGANYVTDWLGGWSPDGNYLGFTRISCCSPGHNPPTAHTVRVDGSELRRVGTQDQSAFMSFAPAVPVSDPPLVRRVSGSGREETAASLSRETLTSADAVVVARSDDYADALAGGPLAAAEDAALLLTGRASLHPAALAEVRRLTPTTAYLLGGEAALSRQVEADLRAAGVDEVVRIAGRDRFDTARLVAEQIEDDAAYVVKGIDADPSRGWPDAVAVGGLAAMQGRPILLVQGDALPEATAAALRTRTTATIVGGPGAVSADVERRIQELGVTTDRVAGRNRYETAIAVAARAVAAGADAERMLVASGAGFADALAAGPAAARVGGVLLLAAPGKLTDAPATAFWVGDRAGSFAPGDITVVGGRAAVSEAVALDLDRWAQ